MVYLYYIIGALLESIKSPCVSRTFSLKDLLPTGFRGVFRRLLGYIYGWIGYFGRSSMAKFALRTDEWLRRRIRQIYWKQWKRISTRYKALRILGIEEELAWQWANTRKASWRISNSRVLAQSLTNDFLLSKGWVSLTAVYHARQRLVQP